MTNNSSNDEYRHNHHAAPSHPPAPFALEVSARFMARYPKTFFWSALAFFSICSGLGMYYGNFHVDVDNDGWVSRGTTIANRHQQVQMIRKKKDELFLGDETVWDDMTSNVQVHWKAEQRRNRRSRRLTTLSSSGAETSTIFEDASSTNQQMPRLPFLDDRTLLEEEEEESDGMTIVDLLEQCDMNIYMSEDFYNKKRLWPKWKVKNSEDSALDPEVLHDLCIAEENTQQVLEEQGLCFGCESGCLPPYSIVLYARLQVSNGLALSCRELADAWAPVQAETEEKWQECVAHMKTPGVSMDDKGPCPSLFTAALVDDLFDSTGRVAYTGSIFVTRDDKVKQLYEIRDLYDRGTDRIEGAYDTQMEDFVEMYANDVLPQDVILAIGSAIITAIAMLVHTKSPFVTFVGVIQIILCFPMAFFFYRFAGQIFYFPFLNVVGVFVIFALGADHVFVAVDKWKNARNERPYASTEDIAAIALPEAASAMFLTTVTTAVAFFGSAICTVATVKLFSIFCGLLVSLDYVMDVFILFPTLCIYDGFRNERNCLISFAFQEQNANDNGAKKLIDMKEEPEVPPSLIHRLLSKYYTVLHTLRWPLLVVSVAGIGVCSYFAVKLQQPVSNDLRVLNSSVEFEHAHVWKTKLLIDTILRESGSNAYVVFGLKPGDNGDHNDPTSWTNLELDDTFDPSTEPAQIFLRDYCDRFLAQDFAKLTGDYLCPINGFDGWLQHQASLETPDYIYTAHCNGETGMPLSQENFHGCLSAWAHEHNEMFILSRDGIVKIIHFPFRANFQYSSPNSQIKREWHAIEKWMREDKKNAPYEVSGVFFSNGDAWFWDSINQMYETAVGSVGIAMLASAVVILLSSRSVMMTVFSVISVGYVLASVIAMLVWSGWTFGLLESVCVTVLIGISVDFCIHFCHAYTEQPGEVSRHERTKHALISMGPSILAAAFTTLASATIMLFTVILFFRLFATVLFFTILQAIVGSFVIFLILTETMGPSNPTYLWEFFQSKCRGAVYSSSKSVQTATGGESDDDDSFSSFDDHDDDGSILLYDPENLAAKTASFDSAEWDDNVSV